MSRDEKVMALLFGISMELHEIFGKGKLLVISEWKTNKIRI